MEQMPATRTPSSPVKASSAAPAAPPAGSVTKRFAQRFATVGSPSTMTAPPGIVSNPSRRAAYKS
ncbi:hypothetical protein FRC00_004228 [Tulasnella sp. 408]|nr:hypothetical protein FRC00_004228 [Tulasnella sp. 408]